MISSQQNFADPCGIVRPLIVGLFLFRFQALSGGFWNHIGVVPHGWLAGYHIIRRCTGYHIIWLRTLYDDVQDDDVYEVYAQRIALTPTSHIRASLQRVIGLEGWWLLLLYKSILLCGKYTIYSMHLAPPACKRGLYPPCVTRIHVLHVYAYTHVYVLRPPCRLRRRI